MAKAPKQRGGSGRRGGSNHSESKFTSVRRGGRPGLGGGGSGKKPGGGICLIWMAGFVLTFVAASHLGIQVIFG